MLRIWVYLLLYWSRIFLQDGKAYCEFLFLTFVYSAIKYLKNIDCLGLKCNTPPHNSSAATALQYIVGVYFKGGAGFKFPRLCNLCMLQPMMKCDAFTQKGHFNNYVSCHMQTSFAQTKRATR